jgi:hypothetical protein
MSNEAARNLLTTAIFNPGLLRKEDLVLRRFPELTHLCSPEMTQAF